MNKNVTAEQMIATVMVDQERLAKFCNELAGKSQMITQAIAVIGQQGNIHAAILNAYRKIILDNKIIDEVKLEETIKASIEDMVKQLEESQQAQAQAQKEAESRIIAPPLGLKV